MQKQIILKIYGKVQGVFFRVHTRRRALELGLTGYVRNTSRGTVEGVAEGSAEAMANMYVLPRVAFLPCRAFRVASCA